MAPSPSSNHLVLPLSLLTTLFYSIPSTSAYSWTFQNTPQQCSNLTLAIAGSDGVPPYQVLIIPFGPSPLPNNVEARKIMQIPFANQSTTVSFQLNYPENSQFVAVVSDSRAFGSGGTSVAAQVTSSNDASCFNASQSVSPDFVFSINPPNQLVQCQDTRISWDPSTVQGIPNFLGVIPGGQSFAIPEGPITQVQSEGTGFTWTPSLRGGTTLILVGGDDRGNGTAGSSLAVVSSGINNNGSCLSNSSPSSTPGSPAGGSYPTGTGSSSGSSTGGTNGHSSNVGAIVGGVIGGVAAFIIFLILLWYCRRQRKQKRMKERPDLLNDDDDEVANGEGGRTRRNELPQYYQPEPFMVPDPTAEGSTTGTGTGTDDPESRRPLSATTSYTRATTPDQASGSASGYGGYTGRKGGPPRPMRAVNIIQHDDAGPGPRPGEPKEGEEEPVTIELPPAYTAVGKSAGNVNAANAPATETATATAPRAEGPTTTGGPPPSPPQPEAAA